MMGNNIGGILRKIDLLFFLFKSHHFLIQPMDAGGHLVKDGEGKGRIFMNPFQETSFVNSQHACGTFGADSGGTWRIGEQ
jgi:hypothetical protein